LVLNDKGVPERKPQSRPPGGRRGRFFILALTVTIGIQTPLIAGLAHLCGHLLPPLALAAALTGGFLSTVLGPRGIWGAPSRARLYLVLWPFFVWWTLGLLFAVFAPIAFVLRAFLPLSTTAALWGALLAGLAGTVLALRNSPRVRRHEISIAGLPAAFDGYRVAQISDLHCGPFASGERVDHWVAAVNRLEADLVAVTGDLIASGPAFVPVVASSLGKLRARDGVFASMGNHDYFTDGEEMARALEDAGLTLLRNRGVEVRRDDAAIYVAGVDDTWTHRHDLGKALAARPPEMTVLLLAHDPALFPEAASRAVDLTLSGHTHGGQIGVPFFAKRFNLARVMTPFTTGLYRSGSATLYVNRGLGSTGLPVRIFVPAEITVITLRRAERASAVLERPAA
jgi:predicted MPP superfamily phosphohydrolase